MRSAFPRTPAISFASAGTSVLMVLAVAVFLAACSQKPSEAENEAQTKALIDQAVAEAKQEMLAEQAAEKARQEAIAAADAEEKRKSEAAAAEKRRADAVAAEAKRARAAEQRTGAGTVPSAMSPALIPPPPPPPATSMKRTICQNCGIVLSVSEVETEGKGSGLGAVGGGLVGGLLGNQVGQGTGRDLATIAGAVGGAIAGNKIEKQAKKTKSYDITVRMETGEERVFRQDTLPEVAGGDKVKIENEAVVKY